MGQVCVKKLDLQAVLLELWCLIDDGVQSPGVRESWLLEERDQEMRLSWFQMEDFAKHFNCATQYINKIAREIQGLPSAACLPSGLGRVPSSAGVAGHGGWSSPPSPPKGGRLSTGGSGAGAGRGRCARAARSGRCCGGAGAGAVPAPARPAGSAEGRGAAARGRAGPGGARCARGALVAAVSPRPPSPPQPEGRWGERAVFGRGAQRSAGLTAGPARRLTPCCGRFPVSEERRRGGRGRRRRGC